MRRKIGIMLGVALLVAGLAAPAGAKKGGHPGPPSGTGLEVTVEPSNLAWANSVGDEILFDVTVTNNSGGQLAGAVEFSVDLGFNGVGMFDNDATFDLADGVSWTAVLTYVVGDSDFTGLPISEQSQVTVGKVTATENDGAVSDSDDAVINAYPVLRCEQSKASAGFTFGPNEEYTECSFTAKPDSYWTLTTKLAKNPHGKSSGASATVRDGVPGNWCNVDSSAPYLDDDGTGHVSWYVDDNVSFPSGGVCPRGGAGGDTIPVRNHDTFYLATLAGNTVTAKP